MSSTVCTRRAAFVASVSLVMSVGCASMGGGGAELAVPSTPRTVTLSCGEQFVWIPLEQSVALDIPASDCWTDWAAIPAEVRGISLRPQGVLDVQLAFADGKTASYSDVAPTRRLPDVDRATGVRYRNRQNKTVRVELALR